MAKPTQQVSREIMSSLRGPNPAGETQYARAEIEDLLQTYRFGYHRVDLPYGLHTAGDDRSDTLERVLPPSLAGKSVLDVGCAFGYYSFAAEARGARRVVGVDPWESRLYGAELLKDLKASRVEFQMRDVVTEPPAEQFDIVLLLNVVHHLKEPFRALRQLAAITRETLIIEFPTLADPKFQKTLSTALPVEIEELPLVGVSELRKGVDQTFVFAPAAIRRALLDHEPLCRAVEIRPSAMAGRAIAFCQK